MMKPPSSFLYNDNLRKSYTIDSVFTNIIVYSSFFPSIFITASIILIIATFTLLLLYCFILILLSRCIIVFFAFLDKMIITCCGNS